MSEYTSSFVGHAVNKFLISGEVIEERLYVPPCVVISDILLSRASHSIVMLINTHRVEEGISSC